MIFFELMYICVTQSGLELSLKAASHPSLLSKWNYRHVLHTVWLLVGFY